MAADRQKSILAEITAALDWWREAGVDCDFDDAPHQWISAANAQVQDGIAEDPTRFPLVTTRNTAPPPLPPAQIGGDHARWPDEFAQFTDWWLSEPSLDGGQVRGRVPPRGPSAAPLMVLVCEPEAEDSDSLLTGAHGRLLAAMLCAMGLDEAQVYVASALPRHTPMVDWSDLATHGLGEVLRMHVMLARPERLIVFGRHLPLLLAPAGLKSPLAGTFPTQTTAKLGQFSHGMGDVPLLIARDLGALLERPIAKGQFWQRWLEWTAN